MSIINNAHPGSQIRILCLIDRVLNRRKKLAPIQRDDLIETCRPDNLPNTEGAKKRFTENLTFWIEEGLWKEGENGISAQDTKSSEQNLPQRVLSICLKQHASNDILKGNLIEPFLRCTTALLCQDQLTYQGHQRGNHPLESPSDIAEAINNRFPSDLSINSSNEAVPLRDWGIFLGFLEPLGKGAITDPTRAVLPILTELFVENNTLSIRDCIKALAERLPMLDGGKHRQVIESLMKEKGWQSPLENRVSASLSHSLLRLEANFQLTLDQPSDDSESMVLISPDGKERFVGTVRYRGTK